MNSHVATCDFDSVLNSSNGGHIVLLAPLGSAAYFEDPCGPLLKLKALERPLVSQFCAPLSKLCGRNRCQKLAPQPADDETQVKFGVRFGGDCIVNLHRRSGHANILSSFLGLFQPRLSLRTDKPSSTAKIQTTKVVWIRDLHDLDRSDCKPHRQKK